MGGDGDVFLTIALRDPRGHRFDRVGQRVRPDFRKTLVLRQSFEVAPGREDQLQRFAWLTLIPLSLVWILGVAVVKVAVK